MWVKICGNTNLEDARVAAEAGADALGFVFAPSPRQVTEAQVRRIIAGLPPQVETYGVFVDASFEQIVTAVEACGLTGVQLHRSEDSGLQRRLHEHFAGLGQRVKIVPVIGWGAGSEGAGRIRGGRAQRENAAKEAEEDRRGMDGLGQASLDQALLELSRSPSVEAVLVDSFSGTGGGGASFDWRAAQSSFLQAAPYLRIIVAGGLRPENVAEAISTLRPWGVDVVSGVEAFPGKKDGARVAAFIQAARKAAGGFPGQSNLAGAFPIHSPGDSSGRRRSQ